MAVDPAMPADLYAELRDVKARLSKVERLSQLPETSFEGGAHKFLDENGTVRWVAGNVHFDGTIGDTTTGYGVFQNDEHEALIFGQLTGYRGRMYPAQPFPMRKVDELTVTSSTFTSLFECFSQAPAGEVLLLRCVVQSDAGTTGEVRLNTRDGNATDALSIPSNANNFALFQWLHPSTTGLFDPRTDREENLHVKLEARRVSGTGNVTVWTPVVSELTTRWLFPNAATDGNPTLV